MNVETMTLSECEYESERLSAEITDAYKRTDYALIQELENKRYLISARIAEYKAEYELGRAKQLRQYVNEYRPISAETAAKIDAFLREHKLRLNRGSGWAISLIGYEFWVKPSGDKYAHVLTDYIPGWDDHLAAFNAQFGA